MSLLLNLPDDLINAICSHWIEYSDFVHFDSALCNNILRQQFLKFTNDHKLFTVDVNQGFRLASLKPANLLVIPSNSSNYGSRHYILELFNYCAKRNVCLSNLQAEEWPYAGVEPSSWQPAINGVQSLSILCPEETPFTNFRLKVFKSFTHIKKLSIKLSINQGITLPTLCHFFQHCWPKLQELNICGPGNLLILSTPPDKTDHLPNSNLDRVSIIPLESIFALKQSMYRLTHLTLRNVHLLPIHIFTLFGTMTMTLLEVLDLSHNYDEVSYRNNFAAWESADFEAIQRNAQQQKDLPEQFTGDMPHNQLDDNHDVSFAVAEEDSDLHIAAQAFAHNIEQEIENDDEAEDGEDDDSQFDITAGEERYLEEVRRLHRPRLRMDTSRISCLDDLCGYLAQEKARSLPNLKHISGSVSLIYPLLPLADATSLRSLYLSCTSSSESHILCADSMYQIHFPSLMNVKVLELNLINKTYEMFTHFKYQVSVLLANMPHLEELIYDSSVDKQLSNHGLAPALLMHVQSLSRLTKLHMRGVLARNIDELGAFFERLSVVAPQLKSLKCDYIHWNLPFRFDWIHNLVHLETLIVTNSAPDFIATRNGSAPSSKWDYTKDFLAIKHLTKLRHLELRNVPVWIRDDVLEDVFPLLTNLEVLIIIKRGYKRRRQSYPPQGDETEDEEEIEEEVENIEEEEDSNMADDVGDEAEDEQTGLEADDVHESAHVDLSHIVDTNKSSHELNISIDHGNNESFVESSNLSKSFNIVKRTVTRNEDNLAEFDEEDFDSKVIQKTFFLAYQNEHEYDPLQLDKDLLLQRAFTNFRIDVSYITTRSLDACIQHLGKLRRLILNIPCLDLNIEQMGHYMRDLPPRRFIRSVKDLHHSELNRTEARGYVSLHQSSYQVFPRPSRTVFPIVTFNQYSDFFPGMEEQDIVNWPDFLFDVKAQ